MEQDNNQQTSREASPLTDALSSILSNPEMMEKLRSVAGQLSPTQPPPSPANPSPNSSTVDGLASILSDPQMMAKLPQIMAMLGPMMGSIGNTGVTNKPNKSSEDCRNALLLALKPFLSPDRCQAIDTMLRISQLGTIIRQIK